MINVSLAHTIKDNSLSDINDDDSILIVGKGATNYKVLDFEKPISVTQAKTLYGNSDIFDAYSTAVEYGAKNIFIMNCKNQNDFIDCLPIIGHYNFSYVIPVGILFSDTFYDGVSNSTLYYADCYLKKFSQYCDSTIIFTDEHASLYENMNSYLFDMDMKLNAFKYKNEVDLELYGKNLVFVLNSLENIKFANVLLAALLANTKLDSYPSTINVNSIFDFDCSDVNETELVFFKNNININDTVENLNNLRTQEDAAKLVMINNLIKFICRHLDLSPIIGKLYNQYVQLTVKDIIDAFFKKQCSQYITDYKVNSIDFAKASAGYGYILVKLNVVPINSMSGIEVYLEVR